MQDKRLQVIEGRQISSLTEDDWKFIMERNTGTVFARTTPQHKLNIVRRCRTLGAVVAVTGDGVNDAPAMRAAHIGKLYCHKKEEAIARGVRPPCDELLL